MLRCFRFISKGGPEAAVGGGGGSTQAVLSGSDGMWLQALSSSVMTQDLLSSLDENIKRPTEQLIQSLLNYKTKF